MQHWHIVARNMLAPTKTQKHMLMSCRNCGANKPLNIMRSTHTALVTKKKTKVGEPKSQIRHRVWNNFVCVYGAKP